MPLGRMCKGRQHEMRGELEDESDEHITVALEGNFGLTGSHAIDVEVASYYQMIKG